MKFLCLAYGSEADWKRLSKDEQSELLAHDNVLKERGDYMAAVKLQVTTVTNWDHDLKTKDAPFARLEHPLAGFSVIEANDLDEAIALVANTPCARANGAIEIRPFWDQGDAGAPGA
ncbi:MAG: YciI family protein [Cytophagaceae bacterium]|nr:YciI family protein [Gemmatimonadaceae bacterium]